MSAVHLLVLSAGCYLLALVQPATAWSDPGAAPDVPGAESTGHRRGILPVASTIPPLRTALFAPPQFEIPAEVLPTQEPRLPRADPASPEEEALELPDGFSLVTFSAGAVRFAHGPEWTASEVASRRDVYLVLSRAELPRRLTDLVDGVWIGFWRATPQSTEGPQTELARRAEWRMREMFGAATQRQSAVRRDVDGHPGRLMEFRLPERPRHRHPDESADSQQRPARIPSLLCRYYMIRTDDGWLELALLAPRSEFATRAESVDRLLDHLTLSSPQLSIPAEIEEQIDSAQAIIGSWKSFSARLDFSANGQLNVQFDRQRNFPLNEAGLLEYEKPVAKLRGDFTAEDDVIRVTWSDGSKINFRWRVREDELLMTDHHGRVSRLKRLLRRRWCVDTAAAG